MKEKSLRELIEEQRDLVARLYYCSNSGEGKKVRKELERRIKELDKVIEEKRKETY